MMYNISQISPFSFVISLCLCHKWIKLPTNASDSTKIILTHPKHHKTTSVNPK